MQYASFVSTQGDDMDAGSVGGGGGIERHGKKTLDRTVKRNPEVKED
jgi:hypothetical protein